MKREREQTGDRGEAGNEAKRQKPSGAQASKPELRRQLSETGGAQNAEANGKITQEDVVAELMKMGGRMPLKALIKAFKKEFACNGTVIEDEEFGQVIQLQGDRREVMSLESNTRLVLTLGR